MSKIPGAQIFTAGILIAIWSGWVLSCRSVSQDSDEMDTVDLVGAAICRWADRCDPEFLVRYQGGDLRGCLDYLECAKTRLVIEYEDPERCAAIYDKTACNGKSDFRNEPDEFFDACRIRGSQPALEVGDPCPESGFCGFGLNCRDETDDGVDNRLCLPLLKTGEQCDVFLSDEDTSTGELGTMVGHSNPCRDGFCSEKTGNCEAGREPGDVCEGPEQCRTGRCVDSKCVDDPAVGDDCDPVDLCDRLRRSVCFNGKCVRPLDEGENCLVKGQYEPMMPVCRMGLVCFEGVCTKSVCESGTINDVCDDSWNCTDGLYCHGKKHTCQRYGKKGESCGNGFAQCEPGLFCDYKSDLCQELQADGAECLGGSECQSGNCQDEVCGPADA